VGSLASWRVERLASRVACGLVGVLVGVPRVGKAWGTCTHKASFGRMLGESGSIRVGVVPARKQQQAAALVAAGIPHQQWAAAAAGGFTS
jgi:hypothetical protein